MTKPEASVTRTSPMQNERPDPRATATAPGSTTTEVRPQAPGNNEGKPCAATSQCVEGLTCTTEAGACNRPPDCGPEDICPTVCYGVCARAAPEPQAVGRCATDEDCRTFSSYCAGCRCMAIPSGRPDPKCADRVVSCLVDPCDGKRARCLEGACVLRGVEPPSR